MLDFTPEQEEFVVQTLDKIQCHLNDIQKNLMTKDGLLQLYKERQDKMIALMESWSV